MTEAELNAPTPLTLRLLGVIFAATFIPWVGAKAACNLRDAPRRDPLDLSAEVLARQPKGAALELQQRAATGRYREAAELAKNGVKEELLAADARCGVEPAPCEASRARRDDIFTRAVLVTRGASVAEVRTETIDGENTQRFTMKVESEGGRWYVVERAPFTGALTEPPSSATAGAAPHPHGVAPVAPASSTAPHAHP